MNSFEQDLELSRRIAEAVAGEGGRAYYVGGFVRDAFLGHSSKDIDIEVYGVTPACLRELLSGLGEVVERGASFGVLGLCHSDIDIAMPRTESRTGDRHTDFDVCVDPFLPLQEACRRRDFTMNAMLQDVLTGEILDFYGGKADLKNQVIRCVHPKSFVEDALRVFRAAQFAARMGAQIEPETLRLCASMDVSALSMERVMGETEKALLKAERPSAYFRELRRMNHLRDFFPELERTAGVEQNPRFHPEGDVFEHTMLVSDAAASLRSRAQWPLAFMLSALMHDLGKVVATQVQEDGRITAYGHETLGLELVERQLRRITNQEKLIRYVLNQTQLHMRPNMLVGARSERVPQRPDTALPGGRLRQAGRALQRGKRNLAAGAPGGLPAALQPAHGDRAGSDRRWAPAGQAIFRVAPARQNAAFLRHRSRSRAATGACGSTKYAGKYSRINNK